jgi:hypothetical protein
LNSDPHESPFLSATLGWLSRLRRRGVLRVAFIYALIAWLLLQIGDVVLGPLGAPGWVMRALIVLVVAGFPVALLLAWFFEFTPAGIVRDTLPHAATRPGVPGIRKYARWLPARAPGGLTRGSFSASMRKWSRGNTRTWTTSVFGRRICPCSPAGGGTTIPASDGNTAHGTADRRELRPRI